MNDVRCHFGGDDWCKMQIHIDISSKMTHMQRWSCVYIPVIGNKRISRCLLIAVAFFFRNCYLNQVTPNGLMTSRRTCIDSSPSMKCLWPVEVMGRCRLCWWDKWCLAIIWTNKVCHPGDHHWNYCPGDLPLSQVTATDFNIRQSPIFRWVAEIWLYDHVFADSTAVQASYKTLVSLCWVIGDIL